MENQRSIIWMLSIIAGIILILVVAYFIMNKTPKTPSNSVTYDNYVFTKGADNAWYVQLAIKGSPYNIPFYYNPTQIANVTIDDNVLSEFTHYQRSNPGGDMYISIDPDSNSRVVIAGVEVARILGNRYNIFNFNVMSAFYKQSATGNVSATGKSIIDCSNATNQTMVMMVVVDDENRVSAYNNCIVMKSKNLNDSIMVADALAFKMLTITP